MTATLGLLVVASDSPEAQELELGPEVTASVNNDGGRLRVEPSAVIIGDTVVVAWNDSRAGRDFRVGTGVGIGWSRSADGGRSFEFGGYLPAVDMPGGPSGADSWLGTTGGGDVLLQLLHWSTEEQEVQVYALSQQGGAGWTVRGGFAGARIDKPAMATAGDDWVGVAYTAGTEIRFVRSTDAGATWAAPVTISVTDSRTRTGAGIARCRDHVLVVWLEGAGIILDEVWSAWSDDGGRSFFEPTKVRDLEGAASPPPGYALGVGPAADIANNAWVACSDGAPPLFHLTYTEGRVAGSVVLYQQARSDADGLRWGQPDIVAGADSVWTAFPSVSVLDEGIGILYYDSRHSEASRPRMDVYLSIGSGGRFEDHRLTTVSTSWLDVPGDREHAPVQRNFGDYITLAADGQRGLAAWTDGRTGVPRIMTRRFSLRP
ncbi:MAG: glycoside hydrolase [Gemmatimonadota bacterium]|nr:glycoside hydrolase [Gemmatimonadota bacterium]